MIKGSRNSGLIFLSFIAISNYVPLFATPTDTTTSVTAANISTRILFGVTNLDYAIGLGAGYEFGDQLLSIRLVKAVENDFYLDLVKVHGRSRPLEVASEYSLLYGRGFVVPYGTLTVSAGLGLLNRRERGRLTHWNSTPAGSEDVLLIDEHEAVEYTVVGVPYEIQYILKPIPYGISFSIFGNVSSRKPMMGICINMLLGTAL